MSDPFDYKLRTPQEVAEEHRLVPPFFPIKVEHNEYPNGDKTNDNLDFRETIVSINIDNASNTMFLYLNSNLV